MRRYELMVIITDELDDDGVKAVVAKIAQTVTDQGGRVVATDEWGKRPLAFELEHRAVGYYVIFDLELTPAALNELERQLKLNDSVMRFKTVRPDLRVHAPTA